VPLFGSLDENGALGGVGKFEPVSGGNDLNHAEEAFGELIISSGDGAVDFQTAEEVLDVIAFLVERPVMFDLDVAVRTARMTVWMLRRARSVRMASASYPLSASSAFGACYGKAISVL
jgi:hypothetical protein